MQSKLIVCFKLDTPVYKQFNRMISVSFYTSFDCMISDRPKSSCKKLTQTL